MSIQLLLSEHLEQKSGNGKSSHYKSRLDSSYKRALESSEGLEYQGFYSDQRLKMSIGLECDCRYIDRIRDFDICLRSWVLEKDIADDQNDIYDQTCFVADSILS